MFPRAAPKLRFSRPKTGVTRIKRDNYGPNWFDFCKAVRERDQGKCLFCSAQESRKESVWHDVHHLVPIERGGRTAMSNLGLLCKTCHAKRHPHMRKAGYGARAKR